MVAHQMDSSRPDRHKTYNVSISLINIHFPKEITPKAITAILGITLGLPLSLLLWITCLNHLIQFANQPIILNPLVLEPPPVNPVQKTE